MRERELYYNKTQLKERSWTESLIKKYLKNETPREFPGRYRKQPQKCYLISVVENIEKLDEFKEDLEKSKKRSIAAMMGAETRKDKNLDILYSHLDSIQIEVWKDKKLVREALQSKRNWYECTGQYDYGTDINSVDDATLNRWVVNFIRHNLTSYDDYLDEIVSGKTGASDMYDILKDEVLERIGEKYPKYKNECLRQIKASWDRF